MLCACLEHQKFKRGSSHAGFLAASSAKHKHAAFADLCTVNLPVRIMTCVQCQNGARLVGDICRKSSVLALGLLPRRPGSPKPCRRAPSSLSMTASRNWSRCACHMLCSCLPCPKIARFNNDMLCWRLLLQSCFVSCNLEAFVQFNLVSYICWCWSALLEAIMTAHLDIP